MIAEELKEAVIDSLWHVWPMEKPPEIPGTFKEALLRVNRGGKLKYFICRWVWEEKQDELSYLSPIRGWLHNGNYLTEIDTYDEKFEWLYIEDLETKQDR